MPKDTNIQEQAKKIWEETRKKLVTLGHQTVELAKKGEEEVIRYTELGRLQWDILVLKRKMDDFNGKLGKKVFELKPAEREKIKEPEIKDLSSQIRNLQKQMKAKETEVVRTKKKNQK